MYTANTMASAHRDAGMALPYSSSTRPAHPDKIKECERAGAAIKILLEKNLTPRQIMTKKAFENAITMVVVLGGSTNAVIHLIAMARAAGVELTIDDFKALNERIPVLADLRPSGKYLMEDLCNVGGVPAVTKMLLKEKTARRKLHDRHRQDAGGERRRRAGLSEGQKIIFPTSSPLKATGHIRILRGNLAPLGAVAKITGKEGLSFKGPARISIRKTTHSRSGSRQGEGGRRRRHPLRRPQGRPRHARNAARDVAVTGVGPGQERRDDHGRRFSGGTHGFVIGHITPEAQGRRPVGRDSRR